MLTKIKTQFNRFKKWLVLLIIPIAFAATTIPQTDIEIYNEKIETFKVDIDKIQKKELREKGKYKTITKTILDENTEYWVDEYDTSKSLTNSERVKGYQIYFRKNDGTMMSYGKGVLAEELSYEWTTATST